MLRQRVITALIIVGAFVAVLLLAPFPVQALLFALVALAGAWEWSALAGCHSVLARAAYAAIVPLLSLGLWMLVTAGDTLASGHSPSSRRPLRRLLLATPARAAILDQGGGMTGASCATGRKPMRQHRPVPPKILPRLLTD